MNTYAYVLITFCAMTVLACGGGPDDVVFDNPLSQGNGDTSEQVNLGDAKDNSEQEPEGLILTQLTNTNGMMPDWSPDGDTIVYVASEDIWTIPSAGGAPTKLTAYNGVDGYSPQYSPDGRKVLYSTTMNSNGLGIWSIPTGGGNPTKV